MFDAIVTAGLLICAALVCLIIWAYRFDPVGRHQGPMIPLNLGRNPYPFDPDKPLSVFPPEDNQPWPAALDYPRPVPAPRRELDHRLYDTGELRELAFAGDLAAIEADAAAFYGML